MRAGVKGLVVDTGIWHDHPDMQGKALHATLTAITTDHAQACSIASKPRMQSAQLEGIGQHDWA